MRDAVPVPNLAERAGVRSEKDFQHSFTVSIPDNQGDFDFSKEARKQDPRIIEITDKNGNTKYGFVFSAGPGGLGRLENRGFWANIFRKMDVQSYKSGTTNKSILIGLPDGLSDTGHIKRLLQASDNYANQPRRPQYDIPGVLRYSSGTGDTPRKYNSNGYTHGQNRVAGGILPIFENNQFIGNDGSAYTAPLWNDPVPPEFFEMPEY